MSRRPCDTCGELMEEGNDTADICQKCADRWASRLANYKTHCWACGHPLNITDTPTNPAQAAYEDFSGSPRREER